MKTVFENSMVAHIWANQSQSEARSANGNFSFRDTTLYSWRTPIGRIVSGADGSRVALISSNGYSMTTQGKHIGPARRAVQYAAFYVPFVGAEGGQAPRAGWNEGSPEYMASVHGANLAHFAAVYAKEVSRMSRARELYRSVEDNLRDVSDMASKYAEAFGLVAPVLPWLVDAQAIHAKRAEREAKTNTPAAIAKRERDKERKAAKIRGAFRAGDALPSGYRERDRIEALMSQEDHDARSASIRVKNADLIARWYAGEAVTARFDAATGGAALRIRNGALETSWGASVPLDHAVRAFRFLKLCRARGQGWHCNGHSIRVGHFTVTEVKPDGSFVAGCHSFTWPEIEAVAIAAGVFDAPADDVALIPSVRAA